MPSFSDLLRRFGDLVWERMLKHPFIIEMSKGILPLEKFKFYIKQDYLFLIEGCKSFGLAIAKSQDLDVTKSLAELLHSTLTLEMEGLIKLTTGINISHNELLETKMAPTNLAYTRHLFYTSYIGSMGEILAAWLPCMWSYMEIGFKLLKSIGIKKHTIYMQWSRGYASKEYETLVNWHKRTLDNIASKSLENERQRMREVFMISSKYEYMFWDMAYKLEDWSV